MSELNEKTPVWLTDNVTKNRKTLILVLQIWSKVFARFCVRHRLEWKMDVRRIVQNSQASNLMRTVKQRVQKAPIEGVLYKYINGIKQQ